MSTDREGGAATVEFALVSVLATALFLAVVQVGVAVHVRNTLVASAAEGARYGAAETRTPQDAAQRTHDVIVASLSEAYADDVDGSYEIADGVRMVVVRVSAPLPVFGLVGVTGDLTVEAHALAEGSA